MSRITREYVEAFGDVSDAFQSPNAVTINLYEFASVTIQLTL